MQKLVAASSLLLFLLWLLDERVSPPSVPQDPGALRSFVSLEHYFSQQELRSLNIEIDPTQLGVIADFNRDALTLGCPIKDCIPSIDRPTFETSGQAELWLHRDSLLLGVEQGGWSKAYPIKILNYHEVVNDWLGDLPILVTYCPLCHSGAVFIRPTVAGKVLEYGVSGRLYHGNLVLYDRQTGTFWSQLDGRTLIGPLVGQIEALRKLPNDVVPWGVWREAYPEAQVLARPTYATPMGGQPGLTSPPPSGLARGRLFEDYEVDPYSSYKSDPNVNTPFRDGRLPPKAEVIGIEVEGVAKAYPRTFLQTTTALRDHIGQREVLIVRDPRSGGMHAFLLRSGRREQLVVLSSYWFAWLAFHPNTELFDPLAEKGEEQ